MNYNPYTDDTEATYEPDNCPECGSESTYWLHLTADIMACKDCGTIVDDDYYRWALEKGKIKLKKGANYPT